MKIPLELKTPAEFMEEMNLTSKDLADCKDILIDWDLRDDEYYSKFSLLSQTIDKNEREHFRNCITYWEKRLNETQSS